MKEKKNQPLNEFIDLLVEDTVANIFFDPLKSVVQTAKFGIENTVAATTGLIKGILYQLPTLIVPGLKFHYDQFMHDQDKIMADIEKKYAGVLQKVFTALKSRDLWGFMFLLNPQLMLGQKLLFTAPVVALNALEAITGGNPSVVRLRQWYDSQIQPPPMPTDPNGGWMSGAGTYDMGGYGDYGGIGLGESIIKENSPTATSNPIDQQLAAQLQALMNDPQIKQQITNSPLLKGLQQQGINLWVNKINEINQVKSLKDQALEKIIGKQQVDKINQELNNAFKDNKNQQGRVEAENQIIQKIKEEYKKFYMNKLNQMQQQNPQASFAINSIKSKVSNS